MRKTLLVLCHELATTLGRRSFILVAFGLPLLAVLVFAGIAIVQDRSSGAAGATTTPGPYQLEVEGFVDHSGLIKAVPSSIPAGHLLAYANEGQAQEALAAGEITAYYLIPADYLARGELFYVYPESKPLTADGQPWLILRVLLENLLGGNTELAEWVWNPVDLEVTDLSAQLEPGTPSGQSGSQASEAARYLPALMVLLLYVCFMMNASLLSESVGREKENRTMEVLMLSISPEQMFAGKIMGLGIAGLIQAMAWIGTAYLLLNVGGQAVNLPPGLALAPSILAWGVVLFLLGYAMYAGLMAGVGALSSRLKEASQATFVILMPLILGYLVGLLAPLAGASGRALPVAMSLFPLTAPVVMLMRLVDGPVPVWQLLLSTGLMAVTAYAILRAIAAMFHAQNLLSGQPFSVRRYLVALFGSSRG